MWVVLLLRFEAGIEPAVDGCGLACKVCVPDGFVEFGDGGGLGDVFGGQRRHRASSLHDEAPADVVVDGRFGCSLRR